MSTERKPYMVVPNVSKQVTKVTPLSAKLEWRIEHFEKLTRFYKCGQVISSEVFTYPHLTSAGWKLDVYPRGKDPNAIYDVLYEPSFRLRKIELKELVDIEIMAEYHIYALNTTNEKTPICNANSEFHIDSHRGTDIQKGKMLEALHPDGSLLVICEVEFLAPAETFATESIPSISLVFPNLALLGDMHNMLTEKIFSDCTLKVGNVDLAAHKCVLAMHSEVFLAMFTQPTIEKESGTVIIPDFSSDAVSAMLKYMYKGLLDEDEMEKLAEELLVLSDKYAILRLKGICERFLMTSITKDNILAIAMIADKTMALELIKTCANKFAVCGKTILQSPEWRKLRDENKSLTHELLELVLEDHPSFAEIGRLAEKK